jgi:hypothetical protein
MAAELRDERSFRRALREISGQVGKEQIQAAVEEAVEIANRGFAEAADNPPAEASLDEWNMEPIIESVEIRWEQGEPQGELKQGNALIAEWTHPHTNKMEVGVEPHEIEGDPVLVWEDRESGELIFRQKVNHPGNSGIGAIRNGFATVLNRRFN